MSKNFNKMNLSELTDYSADLMRQSKFDLIEPIAEHLKILIPFNDDEGIKLLYLTLNGRLIEEQNIDKALNNYLKALEIAQNLDDYNQLSNTYNNIGRCYGKSLNYGAAIDFFKKSLRYNPENPSSLSNMGVALMRIGERQDALKYLLLALPFCEIMEDKRIELITLSNIAELHLRLESIKPAEEFLEKYAQKVQLYKIEINSGTLFRQKGELAAAKGNLELAIYYLEHSSEISQANDLDDNLLRCYSLLFSYFAKQNNFEKAIKYQKLYLELLTKQHEQELTQKLRDIHKLHEDEIEQHETKQSRLECEVKREEEKLKSLQIDYSNLTNVGKIGLFSQKINRVIQLADQLHNDRKIPVLIEGESGTGKEVIAKIIHHGKEENSSPFISINCSAISPNLFESELFGYVDGAFTGAKKKGKIGKLEMAQGGTIFLDEIGELKLAMQSKLLRVIQQAEFYRVGGSKLIKLNVRFVTATNRDLKQEVEAGNFRRDLFHRINSGYLHIPPLRERVKEIAPLAAMFLADITSQRKSQFSHFGKEALEFITNYNWPGNIRELKNAIERIVLLYDDKEIKLKHLDFLSAENSEAQSKNDSSSLSYQLPSQPKALKIIEEEIITHVLEHFENNVTDTAKFLKISRNKIYRRVK